MPSASYAPHLAQHQSTPAVEQGRVEKRSGYSDNSTARTSHLDATNRSEGIAPRGPRSPTFAPCGVLCPPLATRPEVAHRPTRANVTYRATIPQRVGTWRKMEKKIGPWEQLPS
jgi:hypothetical protein